MVEDEENHIDLFIKKVDTDNETQEEDEHLLQCSYHTQLQTLDIFVDEVLLYQLEKNANERIILDKLEKF
ncbi:MAG: hypothetical protein LBP53_07865 [Candidatus Peribacteria bacterium]|nr:hypothetical protein [Candidatus Peribacteria bacterium]